MSDAEPSAIDPELEEHKMALGQSQILSSMLTTRGYTEVFKPALEQRRDALGRKMLAVSEHIDFIKTQQAINAIDNIFVFVDSVMERGKVAAEKLKKGK